MQQIEAGRRFVRNFEQLAPVRVAFWLKESENGQWNFYVASNRFGQGNLASTYQDAFRIAHEMNDPNLEPFQLRLLPPHEMVIQAALRTYSGQPPKIPLRTISGNFGGVEFDEVYLVKGPTGDKAMASGTEVLHQIIDQEANFFEQNGKPPKKIRLPVLMAYDLAKCGREELGELSGRVFKDGITVFEQEGLHGMDVEIVRDRNAQLQLE